MNLDDETLEELRALGYVESRCVRRRPGGSPPGPRGLGRRRGAILRQALPGGQEIRGLAGYWLREGLRSLLEENLKAEKRQLFQTRTMIDGGFDSRRRLG